MTTKGLAAVNGADLERLQLAYQHVLSEARAGHIAGAINLTVYQDGRVEFERSGICRNPDFLKSVLAVL